MSEVILSISKAAKYLGVFPLTLRNWERQGKIKAFRTPGGHRRFRKSDLDFVLGIKGSRNDALKDTVKNLESMISHHGSQKRLSELVKNLRNIAEEG